MKKKSSTNKFKICMLGIACALMSHVSAFAEGSSATVYTLSQLKAAVEDASITEIDVNNKITSDSTIRVECDGNTIKGLTPLDSAISRYIINSDVKTTYTGFIIREGATFTVENLEFEGFVSDSGGVLQTDDGYLTVKNSVFTNNQALNKHEPTPEPGEKQKAFGGAIDLQNGSLTVENSEFNGNYSRRGGAVAILDPSTVAPEYLLLSTIKNTTFSQNYTIVAGGALDNQSKLELTGTTFSENYQHDKSLDIRSGGGAISNIGSLILSGENTFSENRACFNGGAILNMASPDSIITAIGKVVFDGNYTKETTHNKEYSKGGKKYPADWKTTGGGAIHNGSDMYWGSKDSPIDLSFTNNTTKGSGGAIFNETGSNTQIIGQANFEGNKAWASGGAIFNHGILRLDALDNTITFSANKAGYNDNGTITKEAYGGAIRSANRVDMFTSAIGKFVFENNSAYAGGAISNVHEIVLNGNFDFIENVSQLSGGAIYNTGDMTLTGKYLFDGNSVTKPVSENDGGGAIHNEGGTVTIIGSRDSDGVSSIQFNNNFVQSKNVNNSGGAINIQSHDGSYAKGYLSGIDFTGNLAYRAGAVRVGDRLSADDSFVYVNDSIFKDNSAISYAGALGSGGLGAVYVSNSSFINNWSRSDEVVSTNTDGTTKTTYVPGNGGAITNGNILQIVNSVFEGNYTMGNGGAVCSNGATLSLIADGADTIFRNNGTRSAGVAETYEDAVAARISDNGLAVLFDNDSPGKKFDPEVPPIAYFNAGNSGSIIFDDSINVVGLTSLRVDINKSGLADYTMYLPNNDYSALERVVKERPTNGNIIFNNTLNKIDLYIHDGIVEIGKDPSIVQDTTSSVYKSGYFSGSSIYMEGGTISFANGNIEYKTNGNTGVILLKPKNFVVNQNSKMKLDIDLTNKTIDYIEQDIKAGTDEGADLNAKLTIDKLLFSGEFSPTNSLGHKDVFTFAKNNTGENIELLDTLKTVITSKGGYALELVTSKTKDKNAVGYNALQITEVVNAGGLPVAVSIGEIYPVSTYVYSTTEDEFIDSWNIDYTVLNPDGSTTDKTTGNRLKGTQLVINGNGKNIIGTIDNLQGIVLGYDETHPTEKQMLTINDVTGTKTVTDPLTGTESEINVGWSGFDSAIINEGGIVNINNSIFSDNNSITVGGAIRNTVGGEINLTNTSFFDNSSVSGGGAIYNAGQDASGNRSTVNIAVTENRTVEFNGNDGDDIYNVGGVINLTSAVNGSIIFNNKVVGTGSNSLVRVKDTNIGTVTFNSSLENSTVELNSGTAKLGTSGSISDVDLVLNGGALDLQNGKLDDVNLNSLSLSNSPNLMLDINLSYNDLSDKLVLADPTNLSGDGTLVIDQLNILTAMPDGIPKITAEIINNNSINTAIAEAVKSITVDSVAYSVSIDKNLLTVTKVGASGGFPWEVAFADDLNRTYVLSSSPEGTVLGDWINGNNVLKGVSFVIQGQNNRTLDGSGKAGIIVGRYQSAAQMLDIKNVGSYKNFESAVINNGGNVTVIGTTFEDNTGYTDSELSVTGSVGGALYNKSGTLNIKDGTTFKNNSSGSLGGAIYNNGTLNFISEQASNIIFTNNTANGVANDIYQTANGQTEIKGTRNSKLILDGGFAGQGSINKVGASYLILNGDNSTYTGTFTSDSDYSSDGENIINGIVTVNPNAKFFSGENTIKNTILNWYTQNPLLEAAKLTLDDTAEFNIGNGSDAAKFVANENVNLEKLPSFTINDLGEFNVAADFTMNNTVNGSGLITLDSDVTLTFKNNVKIADTIDFTTNGGNVTLDTITTNSKVNNLIDKIFTSGNAVSTLSLKDTSSTKNFNVDGVELSNLTISAVDKAVTTSGNISGIGSVAKTGDNKYTVTANNSNFTGIFTQDGGTTEITSAGKVFGGIKNINAGELKVTSNSAIDYQDVVLADSTIFNHISTGTDENEITSSLLTFTGADAVATFDYNGASKGNYKLLADIAGASGNVINIKNSNVTLALNEYTSEVTYNLDNSVLDLSDNAINNYEINKLTATDSKINLDIKIMGDPADDRYLVSDTVKVNSDSTNPTFSLGEINLLGIDNESGQADYVTTTEVVSGATLNDETFSITQVGAFTYTGEVFNGNKIKLIRDRIADETSLEQMNALAGKRYFQFGDNDNNETYNIGSPLSSMNEGTFYVTGKLDSSGNLVSTISANIVDSTKTPTGDKGYLFNIDEGKQIALEVKDLIISDALGTDGSVLSNKSADAEILLDNVKLTNNSSTNNGGAIYNTAGELELRNVELSENSAGGNGGAIYNSSGDAEFSNITAYNNTADSLGGAIYTNANLKIKDSDFGVGTDGSAALNYHKTNEANDIYIDGASTTLTFETSAGETHYINSGLDGVGNFTKTGSGTLNLTGSNSGFTGDFVVSDGNVNFNKTNSTDSYVGGNTSIAQNATLNMNISNGLQDTVSNVSGYGSGSGTLVKSGNGELFLAGNNSSFNGDLVVSGGSVSYNKVSSSDSYVGGNTSIAQNATLNMNISDGLQDTVSNVSGDGSGSGTLVKSGDGELFLTGNNSNFSGDLVVSEGSLTYNNTASGDSYVGGNTSIAQNATLNMNISDGLQDTVSNVSGYGSGSGNLVKSGDGELFLTGNNSNFSGDLVVSEGLLTYNHVTSGDSYVSGNTYIAQDATLNMNISDGLQGTASNISGYESNSGSLVKSGKGELILTGDNSNFNGDLSINEGTVAYNADTTKYIDGVTKISDKGTLTVTTNANAAVDRFEGNGTLEKSGNGKLTIKNDNSGFSGNLNVKQGELAIDSTAVLGSLNTGSFSNGTVLNLQNTVAVQDSDGQWTTNPNPASIQNLTFNELRLDGNVGLLLDVDLAHNQADSISANTVTGSGAFVLGRNSLNIVSDTLLNNTSVEIAKGALAQNSYIRLDNSAKTVMGPIQKYDVDYNNGFLGFTKQGGNTPTTDQVNPAILVSPVASQISGYLTQTQTLHDGFYHMDNYTKYARKRRFAAQNLNTYALSDTDMAPEYDNTDSQIASKSMWVKPYTTFEKIDLKGGVGVSNIAYGSLYGGDSDLVDLGHGFQGVLSAFLGYNGAHQSYNGISMNHQGGMLGLTGTLYKGNFFTGLSMSTGASAGEAYTSFGTDHYAMLTAGIANKTGYNIEFNNGKLILQPSLFLGYSFVNTFDYTNAAGVKVDSDPLHAIQVAPGLKVIGNLANGWQPYAGVDMVWNIVDKTDVMANDVRLPQLSVKPYIQYGVGVQKSWGERFTAYAQSMVRNGGRNGVVLTCGLKWALGKNHEKVKSNNVNVSDKKSNVTQEKKVIKKQSAPVKKKSLKDKLLSFIGFTPIA